MPAFALHVDSCRELFKRLKLRKESTSFALFTVGSVITDLEEFGIMKKVHGRAEEFLQYLLKTDPKYAPLAIGMIMHEELDRVIDKEFVNPHIPIAKELLEQYHLSSEKVSLAAHYLIDHTVNCAVIEQQPDIITITEKIRKKLSHRHAHKIAYHLSAFFNGNKEQILKALHTFQEFDLSQYLSADSAAALYAKFYTLQTELAGKQEIKLIDKVRLGLNYGKFLFGHHKQNMREVCHRAKQKFTNHKKAYLSACKAMSKKMTKLSSTYTLGLK